MFGVFIGLYGCELNSGGSHRPELTKCGAPIHYIYYVPPLGLCAFSSPMRVCGTPNSVLRKNHGKDTTIDNKPQGLQEKLSRFVQLFCCSKTGKLSIYLDKRLTIRQFYLYIKGKVVQKLCQLSYYTLYIRRLELSYVLMLVHQHAIGVLQGELLLLLGLHLHHHQLGIALDIGFLAQVHKGGIKNLVAIGV